MTDRQTDVWTAALLKASCQFCGGAYNKLGELCYLTFKNKRHSLSYRKFSRDQLRRRVESPKYSKVGEIWGFWPRRCDTMLKRDDLCFRIFGNNCFRLELIQLQLLTAWERSSIWGRHLHKRWSWQSFCNNRISPVLGLHLCICSTLMEVMYANYNVKHKHVSLCK